MSEGTEAEPDFQEDLETMERAVNAALNELTAVPAYILKPEELRDFKAAHYALRNLSPDREGGHDVRGVYDD